MDDDGFERWYRSERPRLLASLTVIAGDVHLAGEVTDEAFTRACERWARVRAMESPTGWTYRTALHALRRRQRRAGLEARLLRRLVPDDELRPPDWSTEVWEALRSLPPRERTAVALRFVADRPSTEVATLMGVAPGTVGSTLSDARARLARLLAEPKEATDA